MELCRGEWRPAYLAQPLMPAAFAARVAATPDAPCLVSEDGASLSYAAADAAASALARRLVARGVGKDVAVGILLDRSVAVVVSMLAVHKAGGCYVPLDPGFPADRLAIYVEDSGALAVISEPTNLALANSLLAELPDSRAATVLLYTDDSDAAAATGVALPDVTTMCESDLAYIMFTSGSTGRPKGVMVPHGGVRDLVAFNVERFELGAADVFCLNSTVGFDSYVTYVFASLAVGGRLVVPGPTAHLDPVGMAGLIAKHGITTMECVPALAAEYMAAFKAAGSSLASLTRFLTGGEALTPKLAADVYEALPCLAGKKAGLFNSYGPTEVTVTVSGCASVGGALGWLTAVWLHLSCTPLTDPPPAAATPQTITGHVQAPFDRITMGRPDHNTHCYIVISEEQPAAADGSAQPPKLRLAGLGEPGELWLSGPRQARGYRNRPDLTAAAFVANPFLAEATAGMPAGAECLLPYYATAYRTGDLVQWAPDSTVEFLGRVDRQVKVNGVRMEVGEVENVLAGAPGEARRRLVQGLLAMSWRALVAGCLLTQAAALRSPGVTHAAVKPWKDANGAYRLVGYVSPAEVDLAAADAYLRSKLLPAMVPSQLVALPQMPRLPNGKIDVKALEEPAWGPAATADADSSEAGVVAPATPLEQLMCDIWSEVLMLPASQLSVTANFFQLGGSSLRAGLINSRIRRSAGLDISGMLIYQHSNIRDMAAAIERQYGQYGAAASSSSSDSGDDVVLTIAPKGAAGGGKQPGGSGAAAAAAGNGLPTWLATLLQCGGLCVLGGGMFAVFLPILLGLYWAFGDLEAPMWLLPVISPLLMLWGMAVAVVFALATKWLLLGRVRPGAVPIWGWFYVRWWLVRLVVKATLGALFPFVRATPALNWFYRALGARIGRNVVIDSANLYDWDMLTIGDNTGGCGWAEWRCACVCICCSSTGPPPHTLQLTPALLPCCSCLNPHSR
jgi:non-ribosomal peptide synthetase component F